VEWGLIFPGALPRAGMWWAVGPWGSVVRVTQIQRTEMVAVGFVHPSLDDRPICHHAAVSPELEAMEYAETRATSHQNPGRTSDHISPSL